MEREGAAMLDIGAQSTRPGHAAVAPEEELRRLLPVLEALRGRLRVPISVDTFEPEVARRCLAAGAAVVNDVSGRVNEAMARVVREAGAGWVLMHSGGGADSAERYEPDAVTAVRAALEGMVRQAEALGLCRAQLCVDPGIGFGKTREDDALLLANAAALQAEHTALLVGASRKRVIDWLAGGGTEPRERLGGTLAAHLFAQLGGAVILRAHDVAEAVQAARVAQKLSFYGQKSESPIDNGGGFVL
jgi:dihydropteroate synthase